MTQAPSWHTGSRADTSGWDSGGPSELYLESLKHDISQCLLEGGLSRCSPCLLKEYLEPYVSKSLNLCRNQIRVHFLGACVHLTLPGRVSLTSSMPPALRFDSLLWPRCPPIPQDSMSSSHSNSLNCKPRFSHLHLLGRFVSKRIRDKSPQKQSTTQTFQPLAGTFSPWQTPWKEVFHLVQLKGFCAPLSPSPAPEKLIGPYHTSQSSHELQGINLKPEQEIVF